MTTIAGKQACRCQCHWDWSWLHLGREAGRVVSDVDGLFVIDVDGLFLFLYTECKPVGEDGILRSGTRRLLESLSLLPRTTVLVVRGAKSQPETVQTVLRGDWQFPWATTREHFQAVAQHWERLAEQRQLLVWTPRKPPA